MHFTTEPLLLGIPGISLDIFFRDEHIVATIPSFFNLTIVFPPSKQESIYAYTVFLSSPTTGAKQRKALECLREMRRAGNTAQPNK